MSKEKTEHEIKRAASIERYLELVDKHGFKVTVRKLAFLFKTDEEFEHWLLAFFNPDVLEQDKMFLRTFRAELETERRWKASYLGSACNYLKPWIPFSFT